MNRPFSRPGFNSHHLEAEGWYHLGNGHRVYSPLLKRFHCPDRLSPFGAGGLNPYAYCRGDPVNQLDPTGQKAEAIHKASLSIVGLSIAYGLLAFILPPLARRAPLGSRLDRWASMAPALSGPLGGLDGASVVVGMLGTAIGGAVTVLSINDPQASAVKDLAEISMYTTIASLVGGKLMVGLAPSKNFTSPHWRTLGQFVHGRKKIQMAEQRRPSWLPMTDREIRAQQFPRQAPDAPRDMQLARYRNNRFDAIARQPLPRRRRLRLDA
ncbi:RHS repeat-associated core domain-containing protein [Pseudomonas putida]|uniref:RHS repeat-associated core domain-containing protein n=1 Tax=Pseudomonas putida TaxID=303 RepID=A0A1Q9RBA9_PSEPU|nr:RHS repeat-associated core domain-containing protein [Pseudomonas putida]OLS64592.1 hypothetical protein PSEMO_06090 [Pseudomonas putida]